MIFTSFPEVKGSNNRPPADSLKAVHAKCNFYCVADVERAGWAFDKPTAAFLEAHCFDCHGDGAAKGD